MKKTVFMLCTLLSLNACSLFPPAYKVPVIQGNIVTEEQISQLKVGMTESQVTYLLGNPMVKDTFKPNEWHYLYNEKYATPESPKSDTNNLMLIFENGLLTQISNN